MDASKLPGLTFFQWSRVNAPNPKLASPIDATDTTIIFTSAPQDEDGNVITGNFLFGVRNSDSYVETIYVPAGGMSVDGLTATGCVRGIDISGTDYNTGDAAFASSFDQDSPVFCNITAVWAMMVRDVLQGTGDIATGGLSLVLGDETDSTVTIKRAKNGAVEGFLRLNDSTGKVQYQNSPAGVWVDFDSVTASNLVEVSATDTTPGYLEDKITVTSGSGATVTKTTTGGGGDEKVNIDVALNVGTGGVVTHETYTPAFLTGGNAPETNVAIWDSVSDGAFQITIDGVARSITGLDFTAPVTSMAEVATVIQNGIRALTGSTETCTWSGTELVITSADTTASSAITVTTAGASGTDISGVAGGVQYMDCDAGSTAAVTNAVLDPTADSGKIALLNAAGNVDTDLLREVIDKDGYAAKGDIIVASAVNTPSILTVGSDDEVLIADSGEASGVKWGTTGTGKVAIMTAAVDVRSTTSETTILTTTVPANTLSTANVVNVFLYVSDFDLESGKNFGLRLKYGATTLFNMSITAPSAVSNYTGRIEMSLYADAATNAQRGVGLLQVANSTHLSASDGFMSYDSGTSAVDSTSAQTLTVSLQPNFSSAATGMTVFGGHVSFLR